ncbi:MAG: chorismate-binding protein, partial [Coriobacteriia bacterium]|nr:chorismate-binding protein [Coriobacteriia bacterium]
MLRDIVETGGVLLAPSCEDGWFGGLWLIGRRPRRVLEARTVPEVARVLDAVFRGDGISQAALAVLPYDGPPAALVFDLLEPVELPVDARPLRHDAPLIAGAATDSGEEEFCGAVRRLQETILAGDVYVANLTARVTGTLACDPASAFATLLARAAAPMSAFISVPNGPLLASVSPERFVRLRDAGDATTLEVWPIKGTRPRGRDGSADEALAAGLADDPKERAEHAMIVDLERNDVGRVAIPGSVVVRPRQAVVPTPYCWQMVSGVRGLLAPDAPLEAVLEALFPCGSVTGAPKLAAMRIIAGLEASPRGAYCGSVVAARRGEIDSSVLIRTLEVGRDGSAAWGTGCGITIDSDAAEAVSYTHL